MKTRVKMLACRSLLRSLLALLLLSLPGVVWGQYITDVAVSASGNSNTAYKALTEKGYTVMSGDLNEGAGGDYVYIGYKTSSSYSNAVTNLLVFKNSVPSGAMSDGRSYTAVTSFGSADLNNNAGGDWLYLAVSRDKPELGYITSLKFQKDGSTNDSMIKYCDGKTVQGACDMNSGAGGPYIWVNTTRKVPVKSSLQKAEDEFKVVDIGGGIYQVTMPMGVKDGSNAHYVGGSGGNAYARVYYREEGKPNTWNQMYYWTYSNYYRYAFDSKSWYLMVYGPLIGTFIDPETYATIPTSSSYRVLYPFEGNTEDVRTATFWWRPGKDVKITDFKMVAEVRTNASSSANYNLEVIRSAEKPTAPDGMNTITAVDPIPDLTTTDPDTGMPLMPGTQKVNLITTGQMKTIALWDATDKKWLLEGTKVDDGQQQMEFGVPVFDRLHDVVAMMYGEDKRVTGSGLSTTNGYYAVPLHIKPFHAIDDLAVSTEREIDDKGVLRQKNAVTWHVRNVRTDDPLPQDQWLVQRSMLPDFSDAITIAAISLDDLKSEFLAITQKNDTADVGTYTVVDDLEGSGYNVMDEGTSRKLYYRVVRAVFLANWGADNIEQFGKSTQISLENYLAPIDRITVAKTSNFDTERVVKVRLELNGNVNPPAGEGPKDKFAVFRNRSNRASNYTNSTYVFLSATEDRILTIDGGTPHLGVEYFTFSHTNDRTWDLKGSNGVWLGYDENTPALKTYSLELFSRSYSKDSAGGPTSFWFYHTCKDGKTHYLDEGGFGTKPYAWNIVVNNSTHRADYNAYRASLRKYDIVWDPNASITIERYSPTTERDMQERNGEMVAVDLAAKTITVPGTDVKWDKERQIYYVEIDDVQSVPYTHYYYKARVDASKSLYPMLINDPVTTTAAEADSTFCQTIAPIRRLQSSMGTVKGKVALEWESDEGLLNGFRLERREVVTKQVGTDRVVDDKKQNSWSVIKRDDDMATYYVDKSATSGTLYEYRITAFCTVYGKEYTVSRTTYGWNPYYGTVSGKVKLKNGSRMPSAVTVNIKGSKIINFPAVRDAQNDTIIIPAYRGTYKASLATTDGTYRFEDIPYESGGSVYEIDVAASGAEFVVDGNEESRVGEVRLTDALCEFDDLDFLCRTTRQFSGRVLYKDSTIPVRDCQFQLNGYPVLDAAGQPIVTDSKGDFSFILPVMPMTLRAYKPGHEFADDGYVMGRSEDLPNKNEPTRFVPQADYDGLILSDATTKRLVGRLIGGSTQGEMPLGLGLTHNNLGDDLRLVLELEGDNTSRITYYRDDPDRASRTADFDQDGRIPTRVTFEKKRIVIEPDIVTGEFCIDLAPTKYKITEMSAKGYATLFNDGEGFQVLDLTADTLRQEVVHQEVDSKGHVTGSLTTAYDFSYQRVVHNPVTVSYTSYLYGMKRDFHGSDKIVETNLKGEKSTAVVAHYDKSRQEAVYLFKYPVFEHGKEYELEVYAHEDYYYNGDRAFAPDVVSIKGGTLKVRNELVSSHTAQTYALDAEGKARFSFTAANPEFSVTREDALRRLTMQVEQNGYYYEAPALEAFVTGVRDKGKDVMTFDGDIHVADVLRDPYGSGSYAYREAGTKYHWESNYNLDISVSADLKFDVGTHVSVSTGAWAGVGTGAFTGSPASKSATTQFTVSIPPLSYNRTRSLKYDMTLNDRIQTAGDAFSNGARADVYIGLIDVYNISRVESFSVIDSVTYNLVRPAIEQGAIRVIQEGSDDDGKPFYLVISEKFRLGFKQPREFVYTQQHIMGTILPNLIQTYYSLVLDGTREEVQALATASGEMKFRLKEGKSYGELDSYETIYPLDADGHELLSTAPDITPDMCGNAILRWIDVIRENEQNKVELINGGSPHQSYSLSSGTKISHSESASSYIKQSDKVLVFGVDLLALAQGKDLSWTGTFSESGSTLLNSLIKSLGDKLKTADYTEKVVDTDGKEANGATTTTFKVIGCDFTLKITPKENFTFSRSQNSNKTRTMGYGYVLETNKNSYLDIDVYRDNHYHLADTGEGDDAFFSDENWESVSIDHNADEENARIHNYVFTVRGGAERDPWLAPDSTYFYRPNGSRVPLSTRTLRIDNPKISISNPVVSNLPADERAVFSVRLTNDSEVTSNMDASMMTPSTFYLTLDNKKSPDGIAVLMDGMPITDGRKFRLSPGESITKTVQVERAGKKYDYEDIRLAFKDEVSSLSDYATFSVHFLPTSTPVRMTRPVDKWVMNTLSAVDDKGRHYLPIEVTGFNVDHDNFDHIELQYKKKTEGDSKWVNICSFFASDSLYQAASGDRGMIQSGTISYRFYGEADPVEMEYDLRAVSFCRLGSGFVTAASNVMSGLKDTRVPEIFGKPKPTNGVLTFEDVISFPFNEPIAYNYLDKTANFQLTGLTNDLDRVYDTSLRFPYPTPDLSLGGGEAVVDKLVHDLLYDVPHSRVKRNLTGTDFTIDLMARMDEGQRSGTLFTVIDREVEETRGSAGYLAFGVLDNCLTLLLNGARYTSEPFDAPAYAAYGLNLTKPTLSHLAMTFRQPEHLTDDDPAQVHFYLDGVEIALASLRDNEGKPLVNADGTLRLLEGNAHGEISLGSALQGYMADVRLWDKALGRGELSAKQGKILSLREPSLMGYWPVDEMEGNILYDKVYGADLHFNRQTWQPTTGQHTLRLDHEGVALQSRPTDFMRADYNDYTLSFWVQMANDAAQTDSVTIFNGGSVLDDQHFAITLEGSDVILRSGSYTASISPRAALSDGRWHQLTVIKNATHNTSSVYLDGNLTMTADGTALCGMPAAVSIGDERFNGSFDNLCFWHLAMPADNIPTARSTSPTGREMGLAYYLPFQMDSVNSQNIHESVFAPYNMIVKVDEDGNELRQHDCALPEDMLTDKRIEAIDNTTSAPPVRSSGNIQNIPFSWTSTDNELQINLNKRDAEINHQYVNVTVRDVEDLAGNSLANPQMMVVYVDRNVLNWDDEKLRANVMYGEPFQYTARLINKSGRRISYTLQNNCSWLSLSHTGSTMQPLSYDEVTLNVSDGLSPGEYSTTVYAVDEDQLSTPLTVSVTVEAEEPFWLVTDDEKYKYTMNVMGRVRLQNDGGMTYYDTDTRDIVAAFHDGVCVGKTHVMVDETGTPLVNLTVYGSIDMLSGEGSAGADLTFQLWQASTGMVSILQPDTEDRRIRFENNGMVGCPPAEPVVFSLDDAVKQTLVLQPGWNWVSLNVIPAQERGLNGLFDSNIVFTQGDVIMHGTVASELIRGDDGRLVWSSEKEPLDNLQRLTYQIYTQAYTHATVFGHSYDDANRYVTLRGSNAAPATWCDLAYLLTVTQPINVAMSDFAKDRAAVGTVIKNRKEFAVMNATGQWIGSLQYMRPGDGYYVKYQGQDEIRVRYTNAEVSGRGTRAAATAGCERAGASEAAPASGIDPDSDAYQPGSAPDLRSEARTMMPVIAALADGTPFEEGDEIVAFARGHVVGAATPTETADDGTLLFLAIQAEEGDKVRLAHVRGDEIVAWAANAVSYGGNIVTGSLDSPYVIDFSTPLPGDDTYGIDGIYYGKAAQALKHRHGIFVVGGEKVIKK